MKMERRRSKRGRGRRRKRKRKKKKREASNLFLPTRRETIILFCRYVINPHRQGILFAVVLTTKGRYIAAVYSCLAQIRVFSCKPKRQVR